MKELFKAGIFAGILLCVTILLSLPACSDEGDDSIKIYEYKEQIGKKIKQLTDLQASAEFGPREGMYPTESRSMLEDAINHLKELLESIKAEAIAETQVPSETAKGISYADQKIEEFQATVRTQDVIVPAELHVNGKNGGYIDFGAHPEYSHFEGGFTVDMWFKFEEIGNFDFLLSTFIDTQHDNPRLRQGWAVNYYGEGGARNLRMTYSLGVLDLYEPWVRFEEAKRWVHIAMVWNPSREEDGSGNPATFKMYLDGELVKEENWGRHDYNPNARNTSMIGFNFTNFDGSISTEGKGTNGYMKHMHIWNSVKSQEEVQNIMTKPETITGQEQDLVCGWKFTEMSYDNNDIKDITGKYSATLVGDYTWVEIK